MQLQQWDQIFAPAWVVCAPPLLWTRRRFLGELYRASIVDVSFHMHLQSCHIFKGRSVVILEC